VDKSKEVKKTKVLQKIFAVRRLDTHDKDKSLPCVSYGAHGKG
jgi:hypothetical protein